MNISLNIKKKRDKTYFERIDPTLHLFQWMKEYWEIIKDKTIFDIVLPGTHDSGSYSCSFDNGISPIAPNIIKKKCLQRFFKKDIIGWTKTQNDNLLIQMVGGARYLDLRVCVSVIDDEIRAEHSIYGEKYDDLLSQIQLFLKTQPNEFIILDFRHFTKNSKTGMDMSDHKRFTDLLSKTIKNYCVRKEEVGLTFSELLKKNHRVYALYHDDDVSCNFDWLLLDDTIWNKWTNTQTPNELTNKLTEFSNDFYTEEHFVKTLFCLQACMTPNNQMIKKYIMKKYFGKLLPKKYKNTPMSLKDVAKEANMATYKWIEANDFKLNIVAFDNLVLSRDLIILLIHSNKLL